MYSLPKEYKGRVICHFDCASDYPPEQFFQSHGVEVKNTSLGSYRETPDAPLMRFGYRFSVDNPQKPHMAVIAYPDDKRRFMCINDGTSYDLTTGVFTGDLYPISNTVKIIHNIFWPRNHDCSLIFSNHGEGEPAAAFGFSIYELESLPAQEEYGENRRSFGIQYEDPGTQGFSEGAVHFKDWLDRHVQYMHHSGQNRLVYPIVWYHGPQFPSKTQPADTFDWVESPVDRKQYTRMTLHPDDWVDELLSRFDKEKLEFVASMTMLRLGNLMKDMNIDLEAIKLGKPTYNNMRGNGQVQSCTNDWTCEYNTRNFPELLKWMADGKDQSKFPYVYGEKRTDSGAGPMFNPLHPVVQDQILEFISEVVQRYGVHRSFKGISINVWHATIIWFCSIEFGYDDYTVSLFEKENDINLEITDTDPCRFEKRYDVLTDKHREKWIRWRCEKLTEFICKMRDITSSAGLTLTLNFWHEPSRGLIIGRGADAQYGAAEKMTEYLRLGGIDFEALSKETGIELSIETNLLRDRGSHALDGVFAPIENTRIFHDLAFLDDSWTKVLGEADIPSTFIFNCWIERWGKHISYSCTESEEQLEEVKRMYNGKAEFIYGHNCLYDEDGFWWESQTNIVPLFPVYPYYIEPNVFALAKYDTLEITRGGICNDKAHTDRMIAFGRAFRALPKKKFSLVGKKTDPVAVRRLKTEGKLYFYAVNTEPYPVTVTINLSETTKISSLWSKDILAETDTFTFTLDAFSLESFFAADTAEVLDYTISIDVEIENACLKAANELLEKLKNKNVSVSGKEELADRVKKAIANKEYTFLRHAGQSYIALKINEACNKN